MDTLKRIDEHIPLWLAILKAQGCKQRTVYTYELRVRRFFSQNLPLVPYLADMKSRYSANYYGFLDGAINYYFFCMLVLELIEEHPNPNYHPKEKIRKRVLGMQV